MKITRRQLLAGTALVGCSKPTPPVAAPSPEARTVQNVIPAFSTVDGAGAHLSRAIGSQQLPMVDPFLLLDEIRSRDPEDYKAGFPRHPHRGFETVTIMLEGAMEHRDSIGNHGRLTGGSIQWMTAGHGIIHSEMPQVVDGSSFWGLQLWVNLPKRLKMTPPRYQDIAPDKVPEVGSVRTRVLAGTKDKVIGPVEGIAIAPTVLDVNLGGGNTFEHELPVSHACVAYVLSGTALVGATRTPVSEKSIAVLGSGSTLQMRGDARVLVVAAQPIAEPVARRGPFVMNTEDELDQAYEDFRTGRLVQSG